MSLKLIARMAKAKIDAARGKAPPKRGVGPLGFAPGRGVEISPLPLVLSQTAGGKIDDFDRTQQIVAVGTYPCGGTTVCRAYLQDGRTFLQAAFDPAKPDALLELRVFRNHLLEKPDTDEKVEWLLNESDGYVGHVSAAIRDGTVYPRIWEPSDRRIAPRRCRETVDDGDGTPETVEHRMMLYGRSVGEGGDAHDELLIADVTTDADNAEFQLWIGIDLAREDVKVL